jgi:hypothetical protein
MRRLITLLALAALLALPALAMASTPVRGVEKRAVIGSVAEADHFSPYPSPSQVADCWSVRSYRGFASANFTPKASQVNQCEPYAVYNGKSYEWQPDSMILKLTRYGWIAKMQYDDPPSCSYVRHHGVPTSVFDALAFSHCT